MLREKQNKMRNSLIFLSSYDGPIGFSSCIWLTNEAARTISCAPGLVRLYYATEDNTSVRTLNTSQTEVFDTIANLGKFFTQLFYSNWAFFCIFKFKFLFIMSTTLVTNNGNNIRLAETAYTLKWTWRKKFIYIYYPKVSKQNN